MTLFHSESKITGLDSESYIRKVTQTDTDVIANSTVKLRPISADVNARVLTFNFTGSHQYYVDLNRTFLALECQIVNEKNEPFDVGVDIYPSPCVISTLFTSRKICIGTDCVKTGENFAYLNYIRDLFSLKKSFKTTLAVGTNLYHDKDTNQENLRKVFKNSSTKRFHVYGALDLHPFTVKKLLPTKIPIRYEFFRNPDEFVICDETVYKQGDTVHKPKMIIHSAALEITCLELNPRLHSNLERALQSKNLLYKFLRPEMNSFVVQKGSQTVQTTTLSSGTLPSRVIIFLVEQDRYIGLYEKLPFTFKNFNLNRINLLKDGIGIDQEYEVDFTKGSSINTNATRLFFKLYQVLGQSYNDTCGITYEEFIDRLCCYAFDLTPNQTAYDTEKTVLQTTGDLSVRLDFSEQLDKNLILLFYAEYKSTFEISADRQLFLNY